ncbi:MAG TPA: hypothetical protein DCP69_02640 [Candidatus Omnitrophica bacterium]|nr:hypothetical protein [Candidatus Omnitrophota bacterium]
MARWLGMAPKISRPLRGLEIEAGGQGAEATEEAERIEKMVMWHRNFARWRASLRAFAVGAMIGVIIAVVIPDKWSNLADTPWIVAWLIGPSFLVYAFLCVVFTIDFVSNAGAHPLLLAALWTLSIAFVMGCYGVSLSVVARLVSRLRMRRGRSDGR